MKQFICFIGFVFLCYNLSGQDIIYTKDKKELKVKIVEKSERTTKYTVLNNDEGPLFILKNTSIQKIQFQNGDIDLVGNQNPRNARPFGINAAIMTNNMDGYYIANISYFLIPQIDLQMNLGNHGSEFSMFSMGCRFHLNSNNSTKRFTPFTGVLLGSETFLDEHSGFLQVPIGINYLAKNGIASSFSFNQLFGLTDSQYQTMFALSVGYHFRI